MSIRIVTDSTSDISPEVADALGITVVPGYIRFGNEVYRDGVDISSAELYDKMAKTRVRPTTSEPTPEDFARVYSECSKETDNIISIHISARMSRIFNSANEAKKIAKTPSRIEVIDSQSASVGLALVVMFAANLVKAGETFETLITQTQLVLEKIHLLGVFDTMKGLVFSDRVGPGITALADVANVKPLLAVKDGVLVRAGLAQSYQEGVAKLIKFVHDNLPNVKDLAIAYSTIPEQANELKKHLGRVFPVETIYVTQLGAALGVHSGSGVLLVALRRGN
ncbi:DegV family protein [Chloroflexota bacterium]